MAGETERFVLGNRKVLGRSCHWESCLDQKALMRIPSENLHKKKAEYFKIVLPVS